MFTKTRPAPKAALPARIRAIAAQKPPQSYDTDAGPTRRRTRSPVYREAVAHLPQGGKLPVLVRNISDGGLRIEQFWSTAAGGRILITEPNTPMHCWAEIVWQSSHGSAGLRIVG